ncbi:MAG: transporter substrate-binding domain-containing protein [Usitatibacter sp.]
MKSSKAFGMVAAFVMNLVRWNGAAVLAVAALLFGACSSPPIAPTEQVRQVLAPGGKLRVGLYPGSPTSLIEDPASGEARGVGHDLGRELARRLGVSFEAVVFANNAQLQDAAKAASVDLVFTNATPSRAKALDFTPTVLEVEQGYLVPARSPIASTANLDRAGVRVGVSEGSTSQDVLTRELKHATVVPVASLKACVDALAQGKLDAFATNKAILFEMSDKLPGSRVLDGRWGLEHFSLGIPKGREQAMPYLGQLAEAARKDGVVDRAVERAGLRGAVRAGSN